MRICKICGEQWGTDTNGQWQSCPHTKETLEKELYGPGGELRDLAHLKGIRAAYKPSEEEIKDFEYKGDVKL